MIFLDASAWLAALSPRESGHEAAARAFREWATARHPLLTTNLVVAEMHVLMSRAHGTAAGIRFLDAVSADGSCEVVYVDRATERAATDRWLRKFVDQRPSLTDAVSFEVMRARRVRHAFTFDRHFAHAGFDVIP